MRRCIAAQRAGRFAQYASYTTCTPPRVLGPLLLVVASRVVCLRHAVLATSSYTPQHLSPIFCGSEGRGFEPRWSPFSFCHVVTVRDIRCHQKRIRRLPSPSRTRRRTVLRCVFEPSWLTVEFPIENRLGARVPSILARIRGLEKGRLAWCAVDGLWRCCL